MSRTIQRSRSAVSPQDGRYIFAYCNIRTNQVLYSLQKELRDKALEQLPDLGANYKPPSIRRDLWKPLWTLVYGDNQQGYNHGLDALRQLREWRIMREYNTKPPAGNDKLWSEEQIKELQSKLDSRGGSKITTVWKLITREKKKARAKNIMNQKQNSIADLAAVLMQQDREAAKHYERWSQKARRLEVLSMIELADRPMDFINRLKIRLAAVGAQMTSSLGQPWPADRHLTGSQLELEQLRILRAIESVPLAMHMVREARIRLFYAQASSGYLTGHILASPTTEQGSEQKESLLPKDSPLSKTNLLALQPVRDVQAKISPAAAIKFILNRPFRPGVPQSTSKPRSTRPGTMRWEMVWDSIMAAQDFSALEEALKALKGRGLSTRISEAIAVVRREMSLQDLALQAAADQVAEPTEQMRLSARQRQAAMDVNFELVPEIEEKHARDLKRIAEIDKYEERRALTRQEYRERKLLRRDVEHVSVRRQDRAIASKRAAIAAQKSEAEAAYRSETWDDPVNPEALICREIDPLQLAPYLPSPILTPIPDDQLPKDSAEQLSIQRAFAPIHMLHGARLQWQDQLDAEYAEEWPAVLDHVPMGITRHEAPDPHAPVLLDSVDYSERATFEHDLQVLKESEAAEAKGAFGEAKRLRNSVKSIRKNEQGDYELIRLEERLEQEEEESPVLPAMEGRPTAMSQ